MRVFAVQIDDDLFGEKNNGTPMQKKFKNFSV